jgi:tetratricopeptide (TPR) repeat protein
MQDEAVREFCEAIRTNPSDGNSRYWLATILLEKGITDDAVSLLYEAVRLEPGLLHHFSDGIVARLQKQCPFAATEEFLKKGIAILESFPKSRAGTGDVSRSLARLHGGLGRLYFSKGLLNGAMLQYREAVRISPEEPSFHAELADIFFITNNGEEAVAEYRAALSRRPDNAEVRKKLGDALVKTRQFIDAFNEYREAARLEPANEYYRKVYSHFRTLFIDRSREGAPAPEPGRPAAPAGVLPSVADEMFASLIRGGENEFVEFKSSALWSKAFSKGDIAASESRDVHRFGRDTSKVVIAKTIAGFLNTEGGNLIIGIRENKTGGNNEITGIENEFPKLRDPCADGYRRMIVDEIIKRFLPAEIFHHLGNHIRIHFMKHGDVTLCWLEIRKADDGVFVTVQDEEYFFIRIDAETRQIADKALVDYCRKHFS